jgi:hypothetical protein
VRTCGLQDLRGRDREAPGEMLRLRSKVGRRGKGVDTPRQGRCVALRCDSMRCEAGSVDGSPCCDCDSARVVMVVS